MYMDEKITDVEIVKPEEMPLIARDGMLITPEVIKRAEQQVEGIKKIKIISIKVTNESDWVMMEDKPCTQNSGNMKIAALWGVSFMRPTITEERRTDDKGEYIEFTTSGSGEFKGRTASDIGTASTRDPLLGKKGGQFRPLSEVDLQDIKKASLTNWQSRVLKKILGLSFEVSDLEKAGLDIKKIKGHKFAGGGDGGGLISQPQANRLYAIGKSSKLSDDVIKATLKAFGYEHSKDIKRGDYEAICKAIEDKGKALSAFDDKGDAQE